MRNTSLGRRPFVAGSAALLASGAAQAAEAPLPSSPVVLNIMDVAGALQIDRPGIERFQAQNPKLLSRFNVQLAPSPELAGKLKAMQNARRVDIDFVLLGVGPLSDGITQGVWTQLLPEYQDVLPDMNKILIPGAKLMQDNFGRGFGIEVSYTPSGPLFEYIQERVGNTVPKTAQELLDWTRAHPKRFVYARPANSGPGWTFLQGLPYILGDKDPADPVNGWDKSWAYLSALGESVDYYPTGTAATMKELGEGTRDIIATACGWDINPRVLGIVPKEAKVFMLEGTHWLPDSHYMAIPKGVAPEKMAVGLRLMAFLLQPEQQVLTYDKGYLYPGPVIADAPLSKAPKESQDIIAEFGRPEYETWFRERPVATPLTPDRLIAAFKRWDEQIGAKASR
jgi:putative spermidine/putrescine transport system substrate-binding protein